MKTFYIAATSDLQNPASKESFLDQTLRVDFRFLLALEIRLRYL
jgi:hypothetical protein